MSHNWQPTFTQVETLFNFLFLFPGNFITQRGSHIAFHLKQASIFQHLVINVRIKI